MNRTTHPLTRLAVLATIALGLVLVTAGQAAAKSLPDPGGAGGGSQAPTPTPVQTVADNSVSSLQWVLLVTAVLGALAIGAALMHLAQGRRAEAMVTQH
jgi:hypothetical protein